MSKLIKVKEVYFDTKTEQPVLKLEDGTERVVQLYPTGNCWVEYWVTPEQKAESEKRQKEIEKKRQADAKEYFEKQAKKRWWQR